MMHTNAVRFLAGILLLLSTATVNGQVFMRSAYHNEQYKSKANGNKNVFRVLSITGATLLVVGGAMFLSEMGKSPAVYNESRSKTGETLAYVGGGLIIASIPFKIAANKTERMTGNVSLDARQFAYKPGVPYPYYPSLSVSVRF